jgi:hypothetical protein
MHVLAGQIKGAAMRRMTPTNTKAVPTEAEAGKPTSRTSVDTVHN